MARITRVIGRLVLVFMAAITVQNPCTTVEAQQVVFSNDITLDFAAASIDVPSLVAQDFLDLPVAGTCGLGAKHVINHEFNTPTSKGTFRTTFEYLTSQCTAEYNKEINSCGTLSFAIAQSCSSFPLDARISHRPWGYCSSANYRVSYLWVPNAATDNETTTPTSTVVSSYMTTTSLSSSSINLLQNPACLAHGHGAGSRNSTNPAALATIHKDIAPLNRMAAKAASINKSAATGTDCDWRFSNLVPVAWDGIQNVLPVGQSLQSADSKYMFIMQKDCNLVLYKKAVDGSIEWQGKWASFSNYNDPFEYKCSMELQATGNLVVRDPAGNPRWESGSTTTNLYSCALTVLPCGNVVVLDMTSGAIIWATHTGHS